MIWRNAAILRPVSSCMRSSTAAPSGIVLLRILHKVGGGIPNRSASRESAFRPRRASMKSIRRDGLYEVSSMNPGFAGCLLFWIVVAMHASKCAGAFRPAALAVEFGFADQSVFVRRRRSRGELNLKDRSESGYRSHIPDALRFSGLRLLTSSLRNYAFKTDRTYPLHFTYDFLDD